MDKYKGIAMTKISEVQMCEFIKDFSEIAGATNQCGTGARHRLVKFARTLFPRVFVGLNC